MLPPVSSPAATIGRRDSPRFRIHAEGRRPLTRAKILVQVRERCPTPSIVAAQATGSGLGLLIFSLEHVMTETELTALRDDVELLCGNWNEIRPIIEAVQRRTGLTRTETMILWLASQPDDGYELESWQ